MKKTLFTYITAFLCSVIGGSFLLAAAYALPQRSIDKHVEGDSWNFGNNEG